MVIVFVGLDEDDFSFDQESLILRSAYFRRILARRGKEREQISVKMSSLNAQYFRMYWHWVYESQLDYKALGYCPNGNPRFVDLIINPPPGVDERVVKKRVIDQSKTLADTLIRLWFLGDVLDDIKLQNTISDELATWYLDKDVQSYISQATIAFVEEHAKFCTVYGRVNPMLGNRHPIREFCVDWAVCKFDNKDIYDRLEFSKTAPEWMTRRMFYPKDPQESLTKELYRVH
jgi:hypothetical protein